MTTDLHPLELATPCRRGMGTGTDANTDTGGAACVPGPCNVGIRCSRA